MTAYDSAAWCNGVMAHDLMYSTVLSYSLLASLAFSMSWRGCLSVRCDLSGSRVCCAELCWDCDVLCGLQSQGSLQVPPPSTKSSPSKPSKPSPPAPAEVSPTAPTPSP